MNRKYKEMEEKKKHKRCHFLLVHGAGHGAWCWYKLVPLLTSAGHAATALDMSACGIHPKRPDEIGSIYEYFEPLMDAMAALPPREKVILVGHSFAGFGVSLVMERFPERICVAVFVTAMMPGVGIPPSMIVKEFYRRSDSLLDCKFMHGEGPGKGATSVVMGSHFLSSKIYHLCKPEDFTLASMLIRPTKTYEEDMLNERMISDEKYGSVSRVYIVCKEDVFMKDDLQRWIINTNPPKEVKEIDGSDHMVMLSKPRELYKFLLEIAEKYS